MGTQADVREGDDFEADDEQAEDNGLLEACWRCGFQDVATTAITCPRCHDMRRPQALAWIIAQGVGVGIVIVVPILVILLWLLVGVGIFGIGTSIGD